MIGVSYKAAGVRCRRIREAMKSTGEGPLGGHGKVVESDEAFVGGKKRNRLSGKTAKKKKVVALVERGGRARSFHVANIHANTRSEEHTSELQSLMRISYAVFCLKKKHNINAQQLASTTKKTTYPIYTLHHNQP